MFDFYKKFTENNLDNLKKRVQIINNLEPEISKLTEEQIKERIKILIKKYQNEKNFESILPESFALTREASKRTLGLRHFDTQLMGGIILHEGKIAEMKTGEGKTLVGTLPVVLNALALKGVHLVTVNTYLAKRDKQLMSQLYRYLGLSVGLITENMDSEERRKNYAADITYVTNSELAFDYLRDNMTRSMKELVLREFNYCIIDEVDSILIDEARTPLIISGTKEGQIEKYITADEVCNFLTFNSHYIVEEKTKSVTLTSKGIKKVEQILNITNIYNINDPWIPYINNALRAKIFFIKDINYIIENKQILIIDEFTGRIMADRRWGDGLHEAVEAKENVQIKKGSETLSAITYQNFFLSYPKFAGMTGTAKTAEAEFEKIYNLAVTVIPTAKKMIRQDLPDLVYKNEFTKWEAIAEQVNELYLIGRPVLIGTTSIEKSIILSELLKDRKVKHRLLNAKPENIKQESEIIAQAGKKYAVTVSTNMAGRGTDILLGGNSDFESRQNVYSFINQLRLISKIKMCDETNKDNKSILLFISKQIETKLILKKVLRKFKEEKIATKEFLSSIEILKKLEKTKIEIILVNIIENGYFNKKKPIEIILKISYEYYFAKNKKNSEIEKNFVKNLGGLYVIGTERHESRRIDNQLRGRAGRQGDPGTSRFFNSLDDNLLRIFGGNGIKNLIKQFQLESDFVLEADFLTKTLENAQKKVEDYYYDTRKRLFEYDEIINNHRLAIYTERDAILRAKNLRPEMIAYGENLMTKFANEIKKIKEGENKLELNKIEKEISYCLSIPYIYSNTVNLQNFKNTEINNKLIEQFWITYDLKEQQLEILKPGLIRFIEKKLLLEEIDLGWKNYLQKTEILKEIIGWRSYGQLDPFLEYQNEAFNLFIATISEIKYNAIYKLLKSQIEIKKILTEKKGNN
jgi:preprotein translocase subunit SecA